MTRKESDRIFDLVTSNGNREMTKERFYQAVTEAKQETDKLLEFLSSKHVKCEEAAKQEKVQEYKRYLQGMATGFKFAANELKRLIENKAYGLLTVEYLKELHPELSDSEAMSLLEFAETKTIRYKECYGEGKIMCPMWKNYWNKINEIAKMKPNQKTNL